MEITRLRGERLKDAEVIHKCYQDLTDALAHIEVKNIGEVSHNKNIHFSLVCGVFLRFSACLLLPSKNICKKTVQLFKVLKNNSWVIFKHLTGHLRRNTGEIEYSCSCRSVGEDKETNA